MEPIFTLGVLLVSCVFVNCYKQPNIVIILADDLGYNDVGFRGSNQVQTPNIDALAYNGVVLDRFYTMPTCTPSRAALLTGNYPIRSGFQGVPVTAGEDRSLPPDMPTLPERLKELNYSTHLVGKWHLGSAYRNATPTRKGFDSHYGYWNGLIGYFNHRTGEPRFENGLDMHEGFVPDFKTAGLYATDLFTHRAVKLINNHNYKRPLFLLVSHLAVHTGRFDATINNTVLEERCAKEMNRTFGHIQDVSRRRYVDIVKSLDDSVGEIVKALSFRGALRNTMILFMSDNGGQTQGIHENFASNWPLRGLKFTYFEGAIRGTAVFYSKYLQKKGHSNDNLMHITDLLPTFYKAGGGDLNELGEIDGVNQLETIFKGKPTNRKELLINIDEIENFVGILGYRGRYKYVNGSIFNNSYGGYYGVTGREPDDPEYKVWAVLKSPTNTALGYLARKPLDADDIIVTRWYLETENCRQQLPKNLECLPCLFDVWDDPCETKNIAEEEPLIVRNLSARLEEFRKVLVPQQNKDPDPKSDPANFGGVWTTWLDKVLR